MTILAHISDLHFGREDPKLINGLLQSFSEIEPELIIISGDLTQRARKREFLAARAFLDSLQWPFLLIAGNHDIPLYNLANRFFAPWSKWRRYIEKPLEPIVIEKNYIAIGINTARRLGSLFDWSRGRISIQQITAIVGSLTAEESKRLCIAVAHHPFWTPEKYSYRHTVSGRDKALSLLKNAGVDIILGGHLHFAYTHSLEGLIISSAGTTLSTRVEAGYHNSFKIIRGDRERLSFETWIWGTERFVKSYRQIYHCDQEGWREIGAQQVANGKDGNYRR